MGFHHVSPGKIRLRICSLEFVEVYTPVWVSFVRYGLQRLGAPANGGSVRFVSKTFGELSAEREIYIWAQAHSTMSTLLLANVLEGGCDGRRTKLLGVPQRCGKEKEARDDRISLAQIVKEPQWA